MKQNDLEQFIQEQRTDFDDAYPSLKLWANIEKELGGNVAVNPQKLHRPWYQIAAAVLMLITLGGVGGIYLNDYNQVSSLEALIDEVAPEFDEMEQYYNQRIQQQYAKLTTYTSDPEIDDDLALLDQAMAELKVDISNAPSGREEQLVQALIESYRLKLQILEKVLNHIEQSNDITPNNESNEISI